MLVNLFIPVLVTSACLLVADTFKITFPNNKDENPCYLSKHISTCISSQSCHVSNDFNSQELSTCGFEGFEQFVCCELNSQLLARNSSSTDACHDYYPQIYYITNGKLTVPNEFPSMVALGWNSWKPGDYDFKCGGVLVAGSFVLTAAHCTNYNGLPPKVAVPGGHNINETTSTMYTIDDVIVHPDYDGIYNDIALLKLHTRVTEVSPACLFNYYTDEPFNLTAIGYGSTSFGGQSSYQLLKADMLLVPRQECDPHYANDNLVAAGIVKQQLCALDLITFGDTCQGDSGGPLIRHYEVRSRRRPYVVGITSFGGVCGGSKPGVYTRVSEYLEWIEGHVWPNGYSYENE